MQIQSISLFCILVLAGGLRVAEPILAADTYDVYLLAGQSNMDGRGLVSELPQSQRKPVDNAIIFYRNVSRTSEGWQQLAPGFSQPPKYMAATAFDSTA